MQTTQPTQGEHSLVKPAVTRAAYFKEVQHDVQEATLLLIRRACVAVPAEELTVKTALLELGLDSLTLMEVIFDLELHYSVQVDEALLVELETIQDLVFMVSSAIAGAGVELPDEPPALWAEQEN